MDKLDLDELARRYRDGTGKQQDAKLAFEHFERARVAGLAYAIPDVAWCHFWGLGTPRDPAKSAEVWQEALQQVNSWSVPRIGLAAQYALGVGLGRDEGRSMQLLEEASSPLRADAALRDAWLAAWSGDAPSQYRMALWSASGESQTVWEFRDQVRWLRIAADAGVADAQYDLAKFFETKGQGHAVELDRNVASNWKWKAALQKHERALQELRAAGDGLMNMFEPDQ